jgi:DNA-binding transcriptional LysR family regulator
MTTGHVPQTWPGVDAREVRVLLILAQELHFGRTAERLGINHSRVSQIVRALEVRAGGRLFERTSRRVSLTPLGERLVAEVGPAYERLERAFRDARETAGGITGTLTVGSYLAVTLGPHWLQIVRAFEARHPGCRVSFVDTGFQRNYLDPLRSGAVDLVASRLPLKQPDLTIGPILSRESRVLMVAKHDPLATCEGVSVEDFADRLVDDAPHFPREMVDAFVPPTTPSGRRLPRVPATSFEELRLRIAAGEQVHPTVQSLADYAGHPNITTVPIIDLPPSETALVWVTGNPSPKIDAFVRSAAAVLAQTELAAYQPSAGARP